MYCSTHNAKEDGSDRHKNRMKKSWHCKATLLLIRRYTQINSYFCYTSLPVTLNSLIRKTFFIAQHRFLAKIKRVTIVTFMSVHTIRHLNFLSKNSKSSNFDLIQEFLRPKSKIEKSYCSIQHVLI